MASFASKDFVRTNGASAQLACHQSTHHLNVGGVIQDHAVDSARGVSIRQDALEQDVPRVVTESFLGGVRLGYVRPGHAMRVLLTWARSSLVTCR